MPATDANLPDAETIRTVAREVIARPEYQLEAPSTWRAEVNAYLLDWIVWLFSPIEALFKWLHDLSPAAAWIVTGLLTLLLIAIVVHMVVTFLQAMKRRTYGRLVLSAGEKEPDPAELERSANAAAAAGDYINAVRLLFIACLQRLYKAEKRPLRRGVTNREILRRYAQTPAFDGLRAFVETIDAKWYGQGQCEKEDFERCASAHALIRGSIREVAHADHP